MEKLVRSKAHENSYPGQMYMKRTCYYILSSILVKELGKLGLADFKHIKEATTVTFNYSA